MFSTYLFLVTVIENAKPLKTAVSTHAVVELFCFSATHIITLDSYSDLNIPLMATVTYALEWLM